MRRLLSLLILFVLAAFFLVTGAVGQMGALQQSVPSVRLRGRNAGDFMVAQRTLVSNFCRLDFDGARLQTAGWTRLKPLTSLRANSDFERVIIVTRFDIDSPAEPSETLQVSYKAVGYYDMVEGYTSYTGNDRAVFRTQEQNGSLMVTAVSPSDPHVSQRAALEWMNTRVQDASTSELERAHLKEAIAQLMRLAPQQHTAPSAQ